MNGCAQSRSYFVPLTQLLVPGFGTKGKSARLLNIFRRRVTFKLSRHNHRKDRHIITSNHRLGAPALSLAVSLAPLLHFFTLGAVHNAMIRDGKVFKSSTKSTQDPKSKTKPSSKADPSAQREVQDGPKGNPFAFSARPEKGNPFSFPARPELGPVITAQGCYRQYET